MKKTILLLTLSLIISLLNTKAQNVKYQTYIAKYAKTAVESQKKHKIPASITLAQGLLESAAGESRLAKEGNNHFGIKCGSSWYGKSMKMDDDAIGECFRCYANAKDSYNDHAEFLQRQRYAFLFDYPITDYKSWAYGLKRAGYATDPNYPKKLISIIELYKLYEYDTNTQSQNIISKSNEKNETNRPQNSDDLFGYIEIRNNGVRCLKLLNDDTYKNIAKKYGISLKKLLYYNDLNKSVDLFRGDYVYLAPKKNKTKKTIDNYTVKSGDSMHSISQEFGIKLKAIYKINKIEYGTPVEINQTIKLHK